MLFWKTLQAPAIGADQVDILLRELNPPGQDRPAPTVQELRDFLDGPVTRKMLGDVWLPVPDGVPEDFLLSWSGLVRACAGLPPWPSDPAGVGVTRWE